MNTTTPSALLGDDLWLGRKFSELRVDTAEGYHQFSPLGSAECSNTNPLRNRLPLLPLRDRVTHNRLLVSLANAMGLDVNTFRMTGSAYEGPISELRG